MSNQVNHHSLYNRYTLELNTHGEDWFKTNVLDLLYDEEREGVVISTGVMDENTTIRRSAIPVELRIGAAVAALADFKSGDDSGAGGVKSISVNRGCNHFEA